MAGKSEMTINLTVFKERKEFPWGQISTAFFKTSPAYIIKQTNNE